MKIIYLFFLLSYNINMELEYLLKEKNNYITINNVLKEEFNLSTRLQNKLIKNNCIFLNDNICDTRSKINLRR